MEIKNPQTFFNEELKPVFLKTSSICQEDEFEIRAKIPERSYEDRDVYFKMNDCSTWLCGEDAIRLGVELIKAGEKSLTANRIENNLYRREQQLNRYINNGWVEYLTFTAINDNENPPNYGEGYRLYLIKPTWSDKGLISMSEYDEKEFEYEDVKYWSPFEDEFQKQLTKYQVPIKFVGYDRQLELEKFKKDLQEFKGA